MAAVTDYQGESSLGNLEILAKQVVEGFITGLHKSPFHGFSVEFAEHRLYNSGDPIKNIDWKLYAKTDKLFSKRYEEETNLRCQFIIDQSSSMFFPDAKYNKFTFSVQCAAALVYLLKKQRDAFGLSLFDEEVHFTTGAKSTSAHQQFIFGKLEELLIRPSQHTKTNLAVALHQIAEQIHKRSLVIIFSDMLLAEQNSKSLSTLFAALQHLKYNKHEVILFHVMAKDKEVDFAFENRPYEFIDLESGTVLKAHSARVKEAYVRKIQEYRDELILKCAQYQIDMIDADINAGFEQILQAYLIKRQKMA